jgi:glutaredoxin-related protein
MVYSIKDKFSGVVLPLVFIKGEFKGGHEVIQEMEQAGQLKEFKDGKRTVTDNKSS